MSVGNFKSSTAKPFGKSVWKRKEAEEEEEENGTEEGIIEQRALIHLKVARNIRQNFTFKKLNMN